MSGARYERHGRDGDLVTERDEEHVCRRQEADAPLTMTYRAGKETDAVS